MKIIDKNLIVQAKDRLRKKLPKTPLIFSEYFSALLQAEVFFKLEVLQPTKSFKVRGAMNAVLGKAEDQNPEEIVTASWGNHGLGVAYAAKTCGYKSRVFLPPDTPIRRLERLKAYGATVELVGPTLKETREHALNFSKEHGHFYVHPYDDEIVIAGQATIGTEIFEDLENTDYIFASVGGGGLVAGIISAASHYSPRTKVVSVETHSTNSLTKSLEAGTPVELPAITSICTSIGVRQPGRIPFEIIKNHRVKPLTVSDNEAVSMMVSILDREKLLIEPSAACSLAALEKHIDQFRGKRIVVVFCGANIALERALQLTQPGEELS